MFFFLNKIIIASVYLFYSQSSIPTPLIDPAGKNVESRIKTPPGFFRVKAEPNSFTDYLRKLSVFEADHTVRYYNGDSKRYRVYDAVLTTDVGNEDLQQCADAVMRLRAEYLFQQRRYSDISFTFTNGFKADYSKWRSGYKISASGNSTHWMKTIEESTSYASFRNYMNTVFMYAGTLSLSKQLKTKSVNDIQPGDVFIKGGSPGHAMLVMDVAVNRSGEKIFLLAQSYMPAQEIHVLKNFNDLSQSPWYSVKGLQKLQTPEWIFYSDQLKTW